MTTLESASATLPSLASTARTASIPALRAVARESFISRE